MKAVWVAIILLIAVTAIVVANAFVLGQIFDNISDSLLEIDTENTAVAKEEYLKVFNQFNDYVKYISLSVKHSELRNIEDCFWELIGACEANSTSDITQIKSRLLGALSHSRRLVGINIDSVL